MKTKNKPRPKLKSFVYVMTAVLLSFAIGMIVTLFVYGIVT